MGHVTGGYGVYGKLRKRLDRFPVGAPPSEEIYEILKILYTEKEAFVASRIPIRFSTLDKISELTGIGEFELRPILEGMAEKGLVMDFEKRGKTIYMLSPTLTGFFEFTFMRVREDVPQKKLAELLWEYAHESEDLARGIFYGKTPPGRALVYEDSVPVGDRSQILTYEVASGLISEAKKIGVGLCYCRHIKEHAREKCAYSMDVCTALNDGASYLVRRGFMREVSKEEALDIFRRSQEEGLVYVADNVKNRPVFVCHCCGCCCGMLGALKKFQMVNAVSTSQYVAHIDRWVCSGCGLCAKRCQVDLITIEETNGAKYGVVDQGMCLGCGVCFEACNQGAMKIEKRGERVITPESVMEKYLLMALEQGKLGNFFFDDFTSLPHALLRNVVNAITHLKPVREYLSKSDVKSRFLKTITSK